MAALVVAALVACWVAFIAAFVRNHLRVRASGNPSGPRLQLASASDFGALLQFAGFVAVWVSPREPSQLLAAAFILAAAFVVLAWWAVAHLGRHYHVRAVITEDHELVTTGPYALVRHPIYCALLGLTVATALGLARWESAVAAAVLSIVGTEIRVRAEDGLLADRFPGSFPAYRQKVHAYLPGVR